MAGLVFGLVGGAIRAATGGSRDRHHDHIVVGPQPAYYGAPCACQMPGSCRLCAVDPVFMSRREVRRELKYERRALKHARKAARWGLAPPVAVYHTHSQNGYVQPQQQQGYLQQSYPQQQQGYAQQQYRSVPEQQAPRRASFDEEDILDQPPQYEPGDYQQRQQRRSVEVLTSDRKN